MTTFKPTDLHTLKYLFRQKPEPIEQAGLNPTADQIELYAYHLPNSTLNSLLVRNIFIFSTKDFSLYLKKSVINFTFFFHFKQIRKFSLH